MPAMLLNYKTNNTFSGCIVDAVSILNSLTAQNKQLTGSKENRLISLPKDTQLGSSGTILNSDQLVADLWQPEIPNFQPNPIHKSRNQEAT